MFQNENGLTASHWQAKSCFKQAIGEDTKGKLMDEIRGDAGANDFTNNKNQVGQN